MRVFATIGPDGKPIGFYPSDIYAEDQIPDGAIEITQEIWEHYFTDQQKYKFSADGKKLIEVPPLTEAELDEMRKEIPKTPLQFAEERIDQLEADNTTLLNENMALRLEAVRLAERDAQMEDNNIFIMEALLAKGIIE